MFRGAGIVLFAVGVLVAASCQKREPPGETAPETTGAPGETATAPAEPVSAGSAVPAEPDPARADVKPFVPPEPLAAEAEAVRFRGSVFFKIAVPEEGLSRTVALPDGVPCAVRAGPGYQVYYVATDRERTRGSGEGEPPRQGLTEEEDAELARLSKELAELAGQRRKLVESIRGYRAALNLEEIPEETRARIREKVPSMKDEEKRLGKQIKAGGARVNELTRLKWERVRRRQAERAKRRKGEREEAGIVSYVVSRARGPGTVEIVLPDHISRERGLALRARVRDDAPAAEEPPAWLKAWARARVVALSGSGDDEGYVSFERSVLRKKFLGEDGPRPSTRGRRGAGEPHPYALFTGAAAIRESMQLDRVIESTLGAEGEVPVETIMPINLKDHPFDEMRAGRGFTGSGLARFCPKGAIYVRVKSLSEFFRLEDMFDRWGGSFLSTVQVTGRRYGVFDRCKEQLCLTHEALARLVGTKVIGELAVMASDPLFKEGTGVAVIFAPKEGKEAGFRGLFAAQLKLRGAGKKGLRREKLRIRGAEAELVETPDGPVRSYACCIGGSQVFANSLRLLEQIIAASEDESKSLAAAPDYRYYRALFPLDERESGFLYLSQDFFRKITGPAWRIARGRRRAVFDVMEQVRFAWQYARMTGVEKPDLAELRRRGLVPGDAQEVAAALGLDLDASSGSVLSEKLGPLGLMRPVDEFLPAKVSPEEKKLYEGFAREYKRYWRRYIDPVGVRLIGTDDDLSVETLVLPLIENSIYNTLREFTGGEATGRAAPLPPDALGAMTLHWSPEKAGLGRLLGRLTTDRYDARVGFDASWFGDTLTLGVADGDILVTVRSDVASELRPGRGVNSGEALVVAGVLSSLLLPTFCAVEVRDAEAVERFLDSLWAEAPRRRRRGFFEMQLNHYVTPGEPRVHTLTTTIAFVDYRVHYAFTDGWLLMATKPGLLRRLIDEAGREEARPFERNGRLVIRPQAFDKATVPIGIAWQERISEACRANLAALQRAADAGFLGRPAEFLGYVVRCPEGGEYSLDSGQVRCTIHGTVTEPTQPLSPPAKAPAVRLVKDIEELRVDFEFTDDGLHSLIDVRFKRPQIPTR